MDNLKVPGPVSLKFPHGGQGQFLEPRALMSAVPFHCCACVVPSRRRTDPGEQECLPLEGWTWEQRPGPAGARCGLRQPSASYREAGKGPPSPRLNAWFRQTGGSSLLFLCQPGRRHRQWGPGTSADTVAPGATAGQPPQGCSQRRGPGQGPETGQQ